LLIEDIVNQ